MKHLLSVLTWTAVALLGAFGYAVLAFQRAEPVNSAYVLIAAVCTYAIGYRFYSKWIAARVLALNDRRATPCEVHDDGKDFVKTNKWIVFGHHFAAISGPGPLVGPVLAAQFGYLPGTIWILLGVVLGGAVQDFVILFASMRRDGKSLGQMVREELNSTAGAIALTAILSILVILLAVLALVVVRVLAESPWGVFTVGATIPIAMFMGAYLRYWRAGRVLEVSVLGVILLFLAVWGGQFVHSDPRLSKLLTIGQEPVAWSILIYGLLASVLPVWLLLAPRDYLSTFMKLGTIFALALGVFLVLPNLKMPAVSPFVDGSGPVVAGSLFPFCFITIACGAISGFHTLISSGTTPKIITREGYARPVGYGAMCLESLVAIMALIAACTLEPGVYLGMNIKGTGATPEAVAANTVDRVRATGFTLTTTEMDGLAREVGEKTLFGRTGGAATLAVGMAQIFGRVTRGHGLDLWYHFATMFEALFILTTLDAGTRVGRYLLQEILGHLWAPLGEVKNHWSNLLASLLMVSAWGVFLIQGVRDELGGINSLWPLFGIANQLLASIALCLATTVILKMQFTARAQGSESSPNPTPGRARLALVTLVPLVWLLAVTMTAGWQKVFHQDPRIGFLAQVKVIDLKLPALEAAVTAAQSAENADALKAARRAVSGNRVQRFNNLLDAGVALTFMGLVTCIVLLSLHEWRQLVTRQKPAILRETNAVWLPDYAVAEGRPASLAGVAAVSLLMIEELSGQADVDRMAKSTVCACPAASPAAPQVTVDLLNGGVRPVPVSRGEAYVLAAEARFDGVRRCC